MSRRSSKTILFLNGFIDSENDSQNENENNFTLHRKRMNICNTSESEAEKDQEDNENYCDSWTSKTFIPKIHQFTPERTGIIPNINKSAKIIDFFNSSSQKNLSRKSLKWYR